MNKRALLDHLKQMLRNAVPGMASGHESGYLRVFGPPDSFSLTGDGARSYSAFVDEVLTDEVLRDLSPKEIGHRLTVALRGLRQEGSGSPDDAFIKAWLKEARELIGEWTAYLYVTNLHLPDGGIAIGNVRLVSRGDGIASVLSEVTRANAGGALSVDQVAEKMARITADLETGFPAGGSVAVVSQPGGASPNLEGAESKTREAISLIQFFSSIVFPYGARPYIGLAGETYAATRTSFCFRDSQGQHTMAAAGALDPFILGGANLDHLRKDCFFDELCELFGRQATANRTEEALIAGIRNHAMARSGIDPDDSFRRYMTAIERLLVWDSKGDKTELLSRRVAWFIGDAQSRYELYQEFKKYYDARSVIVHQGRPTSAADSLARVHSLCLHVILRYIEEWTSGVTDVEILRALDREALGMDSTTPSD